MLNFESWLLVHSSIMSSRIGDGIGRFGECVPNILMGECPLNKAAVDGWDGDISPLAWFGKGDAIDGKCGWIGVGILPKANWSWGLVAWECKEIGVGNLP